MGIGGNKTQRVDIIDSYDPSVVGRAAAKGTLFRYIPAVGDPVLLIKTDDGFSVNWSALGGSSGAVPFVVNVASVADVTIATAPATIDGVAYSFVLLKDQTDPAENGVYDFNGAGNPLTRNADWDEASEFVPGRAVYVDDGTTQADTLWQNQDAVAVLGVDPISFAAIPTAAFMTRDFSNVLPSVSQVDMGSNKIVNMDDPTALQDAATKNYVDNAIPVITGKMDTDFSNSVPSTVDIDAGTHKVVNVVDPTNLQDAATKNYVDTSIPAPDTASNLGAGDGVFSAKVGVDFQFKSLVAGTNITLTPSANEVLIDAAGGAPTGIANSIGYFDAATNLNSNAGAKFFAVTNSMFFGVLNTGTMVATGIGASSQGETDTSGTIQATTQGSKAAGRANTDGILRAVAIGALVHGDSINSALVEAGGVGSHAHGASTLGAISSPGIGAHSHGDANTGSIIASASGSHASGFCNNGSSILASDSGDFAGGRSNGGFAIQATGSGGFAYGDASGGNLQTLDRGAIALGHAVAFSISSEAKGALAGGQASTGAVQVTGIGSFAWGDDLVVSGQRSQAFGTGHRNSTSLAMTIGQYSLVDALTAFAIGNGPNVVGAKNAFKVDNDGKQTLTGAEKNTAIRLVAAAAVISARTDYAIVCDTAGASGALTLPPAEDGLKFLFMSGGVGAEVYTLTPDGTDTLDASVTAAIAAGVTQGIMALGGVWYSSTN